MVRHLLKLLYHIFIRLNKKVRNFFTPTSFIVLYHRVASVKNDPHQLCVSPENFREQIKFLKENFRLIPLAELVQEIRAKRIKNKSVALTFDDGYADNLYNALPILEEFEAPATIFLTAGCLGQSPSAKPFYWDEKTPLEDRGRPLSPEEAKILSKARIIEIGGHSFSHPKLAKLPEKEQFKEIVESKSIIEKTLSVSPFGFAYPFGGKGSFDQVTTELVEKAGFEYACANIHQRVTNGSDIYALPRFVARNWTAEELKREMKKWF